MESVNIPVDADLDFLVLTAKTKDDDGDDVGDSGVEDDEADECVIDRMEVGTAG